MASRRINERITKMTTTSAFRTPTDVAAELAAWRAEREQLIATLTDVEAQLPAARERVADAERVWNQAFAERLAATGEPTTTTTLTPIAPERKGVFNTLVQRGQPDQAGDRDKLARADEARQTWDVADEALRHWRCEATRLDGTRSRALDRLMMVDGRIEQLQNEHTRLTAHTDRRGTLLAGLRSRLTGDRGAHEGAA